MKIAIKHGIIEFVAECLEQFDYLVWRKIANQTMIQMAIAERNDIIVSMLCDFGDTYGEKFSLLSETDGNKNTILYYAAKLAPPIQLDLVSGVALQIQRELQWYKGVESIMPKNDKFKRNKEGHTAQVVFTKEHKDLLNEGEVWMKDTSGSCMIVGALIATVAFAAAFTNNQMHSCGGANNNFRGGRSRGYNSGRGGGRSRSFTGNYGYHIFFKYGHSAAECRHRRNFSYQGHVAPQNLSAMMPYGPYSAGILGENPWYFDVGATNPLTSNMNNLHMSAP
ncbi:uncharacterized protein LOC113351944 [Papaver somniferum]|uniref:uncharacterized protein LOC113351944 n=1 Tax=Papaver somniferum TaxID=3469 RepID=UPI000E6FFC7E|nr:uncharacterized protein LOC113351944 [Papaver somniferum]